MGQWGGGCMNRVCPLGEQSPDSSAQLHHTQCELLSSSSLFSNCSFHREQRSKLDSAQAKASQFKQTGRGYSWEPRERMHRRKMQLWRSPRSVWKHRENSEYHHHQMATPSSPILHLCELFNWGMEGEGGGNSKEKACRDQMQHLLCFILICNPSVGLENCSRGLLVTTGIMEVVVFLQVFCFRSYPFTALVTQCPEIRN